MNQLTRRPTRSFATLLNSLSERTNRWAYFPVWIQIATYMLAAETFLFLLDPVGEKGMLAQKKIAQLRDDAAGQYSGLVDARMDKIDGDTMEDLHYLLGRKIGLPIAKYKEHVMRMTDQAFLGNPPQFLGQLRRTYREISSDRVVIAINAARRFRFPTRSSRAGSNLNILRLRDLVAAAREEIHTLTRAFSANPAVTSPVGRGLPWRVEALKPWSVEGRQIMKQSRQALTDKLQAEWPNRIYSLRSIRRSSAAI